MPRRHTQQRVGAASIFCLLGPAHLLEEHMAAHCVSDDMAPRTDWIVLHHTQFLSHTQTTRRVHKASPSRRKQPGNNDAASAEAVTGHVPCARLGRHVVERGEVGKSTT